MNLRRQYFLSGLIALLLLAPVSALGLLAAVQPRGAWADWLLNRTLSGVTLPAQNTRITFRTWFDGSFQRSVTRWIDQRFCGRELFIRVYNQVLWTLFEKSYMAGESVIAGRNGQLFEAPYLTHFSGVESQSSDEDLDLLARRIRTLQRRLAERGVAFVVVFTPSKALFLPGAVPARYQPRGAGGPPQDRERLRGRLERFGIAVVDGVALTHAAESRLPVPAFPKTGTHWIPAAAYFTAEAVLREVESAAKKPLARLALTPGPVLGQREGLTEELAKLLNLMAPPGDPYLRATFARTFDSPRRAGRLTIVGGSYVNQLLSVWEQAEAWEQIVFYYYFGRRTAYPADSSAPVDRRHVDWISDFCRADAVVLELNESILTAAHLEAFFSAALGGIAAPNDRGYPSIHFDPATWHAEEADGVRRWHWSRGRVAALTVKSMRPEKTGAVLSGRIYADVRSQTLRLLAANGDELWRGRVEPGRFTSLCVRLPSPAAAEMDLRLVSDAPPAVGSGPDVRPRGFAWFDFAVESDP